ncbi:MAG: thioredoxin family protein [Saprospiraceae bacterium]|nr:thioredoxin family protein [Bacteroidia bacterium]NNF22719.1 thioredoxin family protein [Saprospiraceae bacterium]NNK89984.1 thioredoxin family protein [Saprospiraceae bacterium]
MRLTYSLSLIISGLAFFAFTIIGDGYKVGDTATDFSLKGVDGKMVSLTDFPDAKGFIITFTCNHCPYAVLYEDRLIELHNKFAPQGYPVIAINPNDPEVQPADSYEAMQKRAEEKAFPFPYLFDEGQNIYPQYGATKTPHIFLLNKDKVVKYIGAIDDNPRNPDDVKVNYVENAIGAIENGEKPDPDFTKAIGCSIKTKS